MGFSGRISCLPEPLLDSIEYEKLITKRDMARNIEIRFMLFAIFGIYTVI